MNKHVIEQFTLAPASARDPSGTEVLIGSTIRLKEAVRASASAAPVGITIDCVMTIAARAITIDLGGGGEVGREAILGYES